MSLAQVYDNDGMRFNFIKFYLNGIKKLDINIIRLTITYIFRLTITNLT